MKTPWMRLLVVMAAATLAIFAIACNDDDDDGGDGDETPSASEGSEDLSEDEQAINDVIDEFLAAWNGQDYAATAALHTEAGLQSQLDDGDGESDLTTEEGRMVAFEGQTAESTIVIDSVGEITAEGTTGTAAVEAHNESRETPAPGVLVGVNLGFVKEADEWLINSVDFEGEVAAPESGTAIPVDANEFAFAITEEPADGNIYFAVANKGQQPHHVVVVKVPDADFDVEAALQSEEEPEGTTDLGGTPPWDAGVTKNVVFSEPLEAGFYVLLCFMPDTADPEMTPHAFKGMWAKFSIP